MDLLRDNLPYFQTISLSFLIPYLFLSRHSLSNHGLASLRSLLTFLVVIHTLYTLRLLLSPPVNFFTLLDLPLTAPVSAIRIALLGRQKDKYPVAFLNKISPDIETLLTRLASFEARVIYVKYGPYPLSYCVPCIHLTDFAIFAFAPTVLPYLTTLILVSLLTSRPSSRPAWRTPCMIILAATLLTEVWWTVDGSVPFQDGKLTGWTHTHTFLARHTVLLLLPLVVHHLPAHSSLSTLPPFIVVPPSRPAFPHHSSDFQSSGAQSPQTPHRPSSSHPTSTPLTPQAGSSSGVPNPNPNPEIPSSPFTTLNYALSSLSTTINTLRVLEWAHLAGMRRQELREQITDFYATAEMNAGYARSDGELVQEAERLGMGYQEQRSRAGWRVKGDPRGLDNDSMMDADDDGESGDEQQGLVLKSPLRAKARQAAREIVDTYLKVPGSDLGLGTSNNITKPKSKDDSMSA